MFVIRVDSAVRHMFRALVWKFERRNGTIPSARDRAFLPGFQEVTDG